MLSRGAGLLVIHFVFEGYWASSWDKGCNNAAYDNSE